MPIRIFKCKECGKIIFAFTENTLRENLKWHLMRNHRLELDVAAAIVRDWLGSD